MLTISRGPVLGSSFEKSTRTLRFALYSKNATRIELALFDRDRGSSERMRLQMTRDADDVWSVSMELAALAAQGCPGPVYYYGYRAFGPNWTYDPAWQPGSTLGFAADVDPQGNRFNPNKLLIDPYARELSHDPEVALTYLDPNVYVDAYYGGDTRNLDTGPIAPKSIAFTQTQTQATGQRPARALKDDVICEVHLRGFTMRDPSIPAAERGTYLGAARKARYLRELGVTAVEFLPLHHFASEQNDDGDPRGDNYWGYMTLGYFAPNRRYALDRSPGGPTREFRAMVKAFHDQGIKVFLDVVYNHTGEGMPLWSPNPRASRAT